VKSAGPTIGLATVGQTATVAAPREGAAVISPNEPLKVPWFGDGVDRTGRRCRVICRSKRMNSAWIEFEDGFQTNTSRGGLRRVTQEES
jgi:hypothetical protein